MPPRSNGTTPDPAVFSTENQLHLESVHKAITQPHEFAKVFCDACKSQVEIKDSIKEVFKEYIKDNAFSVELDKLLKQKQKEFLFLFGRNIFNIIWSVGMLVLGAFLASVFK